MKHIIILAFFLVKVCGLFSQIMFPKNINEGGLRDTSNYSELRSKIEIQSMFLKIDSNDVSTYFKRANLNYQIQNYQECINDINLILKRFPNYAADAYTNRGMCYCFMSKNDSAINDLNKAKILTPKDPKSYLNLAYAESVTKNYISAIAYLDTAIELKPNYAKAYANRGFAKEKIEKFGLAILDYNKAIEIDPNYFEVYFNRGFSNYSLRNYTKAINDYNKALEIQPKLASTDFFTYRGMAYEKKGDITNAQLDYTRAEKMKATK